MTSLPYPPKTQRKSVLGVSLLAGVAMAFGCTAGVNSTATGVAGTGGSHAGSAGAGGTGTPGIGGNGVGGTLPPIGGFGGGGGGCMTATYDFVPTIPTVYLVVDRSGSMFHCLSSGELVCPTQSDTSWSKLKDAIESVLTQLDSMVRFGFTTIYGTNPASGGSCPVLDGKTLSDNVAPALNNAAAIKALYDGLAWPSPNDASTPGKKLESPASEVLAAATKALMGDTTPGDKYMIFITDGQEDYCDDSIDICSSDSTVWRLQAANAAGIKTIVFGLQTAQFNLAAGVLQAFANAGAGEPTVAPLHAGGSVSDFYYQCNGGSGGLWATDLTTAGKTGAAGVTLGAYSATSGPTMPYTPNAADQTMLATQLSAALSGVKSCTFDLNNIGNGQKIVVTNTDASSLGRATVTVDGKTVPLDTNNGNGWDLTSNTQLQLFGPACDAWRSPDAKTINFDFPCDIIGPG